MQRPTTEELDNRYTYHAPAPDQVKRYETIRAACRQLAEVIALNTVASREQSTALTHLDSVMFFTNAAIARNEVR